MDLHKLADEYIHLDRNERDQAEIRQLVDSGNQNELQDRLASRLTFGTAGLRAAMGAGYSRMNDLTVVQASQPFAITQLKASVGIMITASHNPKQDNGYKLYGSNGSQIISPVDKDVAKRIEENLTPWIWDYTLAETSPLSLDPEHVIPQYFDALSKLSFSKDRNATSNLKICYTAMHGVGYEYAVKAFEAFELPRFIPVAEQIYPDPDFSTVQYPNPEEGKGALALAMKTADAAGAPVIFANDPDADRLGVAEKLQDGTWHIFSGNELGAILGVSLWRRWRERNANVGPRKVAMLISTVSSKLLHIVAQLEGFRCEETLTGFKWLGNRAHQLTAEGYEVLFAFEEAIGFMVGSTVRDKDGISALAVLAEIATDLHREGVSLYDFLQSIYQKYGYFVSNNSYFICHDPAVIKAVFERIRYGDSPASSNPPLAYPKTIGKCTITGIRDLTIGYDSTQAPPHTPLLPVSKSTEMITFTLDNGCTITLRTSGTEPKIKYYSELSGETREGAERELEGIVREF
ncbi:Phosphoglucomutase-2, partial [Rhizophlyctis rosea]